MSLFWIFCSCTYICIYTTKLIKQVLENAVHFLFTFVLNIAVNGVRFQSVVSDIMSNVSASGKRLDNTMYHQTSNIRSTFVDNKIVDYSDAVGASPVGAAPTTSSFSIAPGFNGFGKDNCKTRCETFEFRDLVHPILEVWRYC